MRHLLNNKTDIATTILANIATTNLANIATTNLASSEYKYFSGGGLSTHTHTHTHTHTTTHSGSSKWQNAKKTRKPEGYKQLP